MNTQTMTGAGQALIAAGLTVVANDMVKGLILIGIGSAMIVGVAVLQKVGLEVAGREEQG